MEEAAGDVLNLDAEQFLSNFTSLREECDRFKTENQSLQLRCQQLTQENSQCQMEKHKEALKHKEIIWNLKLELQKSQEERLSWKEKYLDLCIKSSQAISKELMEGKVNYSNHSKYKKKKLKKKNKEKDKVENTDTAENTVIANADKTVLQENVDDVIKNVVNPEIDETAAQTNEENTLNSTINDHVEEGNLSINPSLSVESNQISSVALVPTVTSDMNIQTAPNINQNAAVTTNTTELYSLQPTFELSQAQPVSGGTTFILQTSDATFCATAVMDNDQRANEYLNQGVKFEVKNDNTFHNGSVDADPDSEGVISTDENKEFNFRCAMCNYTYSDQEMLEKHIKAKHTIKRFRCKECGKIYSTKSSLAQHVHHYHRHPNKYQCEICSKKFHRKDFLVKHVKTHSDVRDFKCKHCNKTFKTQASLSGHVNGSHNDKRRYVCDYCGMTTSWRISHLEHIKLHTGEPRKSMRRKKQQELKKEQQQQQQAIADLHYVTPGAVVQFISAE